VVVVCGAVLGAGLVAVAGGGALVLGDTLVDGGELEPGIAGSGKTAVSFFAEPLAITRAMTSATTNKTAAPAAIHNHRGGFDCLFGDPPCGGSATGDCPYCHSGADWPCSQYCGNRSVEAFAFGSRRGGMVDPYVGP
jgi:hypothetical protein